jgi:Domain of unknown function (DUF4271)
VRIRLLFFIFCVLQQAASFAQNGADTVVPRRDSVPVKKDSSVTIKKDSAATTVKDTTLRKTPVIRDSNAVRKPRAVIDSVADTPSSLIADTVKQVTSVATAPEETDTAKGYTIKGFLQVLREHPYFNFFGKPVSLVVHEKKSENKDVLFYFMTGLLVYYGLMRLFFGRYISNLLALFFRATMRQQQIRDQLMQSPLPSLLLNFLFLVTGGLFLTFVAFNYGLSPVSDIWSLLPWCMALLLVIYTGKMIILKITGWIFNVTVVTDTYIFIVFLVNKMIGMFLLPVLVVMGFADPPLFNVLLTLTFMMLVFFLGYRFLISYSPIRNEIKVNRFHFFLYLCAFEIAPLLLIYKVLLIFLERSH